MENVRAPCQMFAGSLPGTANIAFHLMFMYSFLILCPRARHCSKLWLYGSQWEPSGSQKEAVSSGSVHGEDNSLPLMGWLLSKKKKERKKIISVGEDGGNWNLQMEL
jgi:hypothetical protein